MSDGTASADRKWIAIAGNVISAATDPERAKAAEAARLVGRALAAAGYGIVVYSAKPDFVERHVVEGYVQGGAAKPGSIRMVYPAGKADVAFPERTANGALFVDEPDHSVHWETSYYESLGTANGLFVLGGGRSTLIAGLVAIGYGRAVVPVASFGGHARTLWDKLSASGGALTKAELALLAGSEWTEESARGAVAIFGEHARRVKEREDVLRAAALQADRRTKAAAVLAIILTLMTAVSVVAVYTKPEIPGWGLRSIFLLAAVCAGIAGATIRTLSDVAEHRLEGADQPFYMRTTLGVIAAVLTALLMAVPQVSADTKLPERVTLSAAEKEEIKTERLRSAIPAAVVGALLAAFATDQFYRKLRELKLKELELPGKV